MRWPKVSTIVDFLRGLKEIVTDPGEYVPQRCLIDGTPMHEIGSREDGGKVYECERGHTFSPGVNVGDRDKIIEQTKGDTHGDI